MEQTGSLKRSLGFWALVAYGVGDILGAGIYALIGKIAGIAGTLAWLAFAVALGVAALTALSYAELGGRFPKSGGESYFCQEAFRRDWLALLIGWLVLCSGVVSMATISRASAGYFQSVVPGLPVPVIITAFLVGLAAINFWGMRQSSAANIVCTVVELTGLLIVIVVGARFLGQGMGVPTPAPASEGTSWPLVLQAGALAFFAFIGFEDMVNVAEEVKAPERDMPKAILVSLSIAAVLYIVIALIAVSVVAPQDLAASSAPLLEVVRTAAPAFPAWVFVVIALFAVSNTSLLNFIMASRLIYGMAQQGLLPAKLGAIHPRRQTPHVAILVILFIALGLALSGTLTFLAGTTSVLLLGVFFVVNVALVVIKRRPGPRPAGFQVPLFVPVLGALASLGLMRFVPPSAFLTALVILALGVVVVGARRIATRPPGAAS